MENQIFTGLKVSSETHLRATSIYIPLSFVFCIYYFVISFLLFYLYGILKLKFH